MAAPTDAEMGVAEISKSLLDQVTHYHAQIGHNVRLDALQDLECKLLATAKELFHQKKFEEALNTFTHCLAVTEKTRTSKDQAVRGAVIHNIASCLHNLGELEAAQAYYEQAIQAFQKAETPVIEKAFFGDVNKRRISFVKERLVDITWGRRPECDKYLDENGNKRPVRVHYPPPSFPGGHDLRGTAHTRRDDVEELQTSRGEVDEVQERARKEWLQYYLEVGDWEKAADLVVTKGERDDLEYLMQSGSREPNSTEPRYMKKLGAFNEHRIQEDEDSPIL
ncbi:hypothetical protein AB1Y20_008198 [Prymnesium parvum]|uniref:Uncharacterized protein n=1 Tax=Prymnesium parvum TaxID=97485 RepID=A0AB34ITN5_PRYPA